MEHTLQQFLDDIRTGRHTIPACSVEAILAEYPFFGLAAAMLLKDDDSAAPLSPAQIVRLRAAVALNGSDPAETMKLIDPDGDRWINFYPAKPIETKTTEDIIDTFISNYGHVDEKENALLERLIFNPTPDYSQLLEQEAAQEMPVPETPTGNEQVDRINAFIAANTRQGATAAAPLPEPAAAPVKPAPQAAAPANPPVRRDTGGSFSESLAKIYVKQKKFAKAYEIIHNLSVNHPDRSRYYADQLRFLRKAIIARGGTPPSL